jgi:ABC-type Na+ transport system ATPase subunit NatA
METAASDYPIVHLFDEPQFNTQDGYIGFMLDFFKKLRGEGRLIFMSLHPTEQYHLQIVQEICERFMFVFQGQVFHFESWEQFVADERVRTYLGKNLEAYETLRS